MKFETYQKHDIYRCPDGDRVDVIFKGKDSDRLDRFTFYLSIGMAVCQHDDLLQEILSRLGGASDE